MSEEESKDRHVQHFLDLIRRSRRGKFKIYIGMSAGVGKTYRMLQEAHALLKNGIDVKIGYIETHNRAETLQMAEGLPQIPRKQVFYKSHSVEEMDIDNIIRQHPEVVLVDELAHSNIPGSKNEKRWQDVAEVLEAGINVISAVNIQHIESLNREIEEITGIEVRERIPDSVLHMADEVVNIDLTADDLIARLNEGKIYHPSKVEAAVRNFFQREKILQLREMALKEVAHQVERKIDTEIIPSQKIKPERFLACISTNDRTARHIIRKTARLAAYYNSLWYVLFVETRRESPDRISLTSQRHLINNFKLATELGGEVIRKKNGNRSDAIAETASEKGVTTICLGKPSVNILGYLTGRNIFWKLLRRIDHSDIDIIILS
jgi:two-component system sensor histidine kinase KdpD